MFPLSHYQPACVCVCVCVRPYANMWVCVSTWQRVQMWRWENVVPSFSSYHFIYWGLCLCLCACVFLCASTASVHWRVVGEEKERDKHLQAAIMGNFPTAAKLKPPKTKQRGQIYSLDESVTDAHNRERGRERESDDLHTKLQATSMIQILTSHFYHVVEPV